MDYNELKSLILKNIEYKKELIDIIYDILQPLENEFNNDIEDNIIKFIKNNQIDNIIRKINKELNNLKDKYNYDNLKNLTDFLYIFTTIYKYLVQIDNNLSYIINIINIDYNEYNVNYTNYTKIQEILKKINNINIIYIEKNKQFIDNIHSYYINIIDRYINKEELYICISNIFIKYNEIINLYIILFNKGFSIDNKSLIEKISIIYEEDKDKLLNINYTINNNKNIVLENYLQTFGLISKFLIDDNSNILNLYDLLYKLFTIKINKDDNLLDTLDIIIKNYSNKYKCDTSLIILTIHNTIDYNIDALLINNINIEKQGITCNIIKNFNTIINSNSKYKQNNIIKINHNENTKQSIILQTNDLIKFKLLFYNNSYKIPYYISNKLLRNSYSKRIELYNEFLENDIIKYKTTEYIEKFSIDKYLNFDSIDEKSENIYNKLSTKIITDILTIFKKNNLTDLELFDIINNKDKIINIFNNSLNNFYENIIKTIDNIDADIINNIYISYLGLCENLSFKLNKSITDKYIFYNKNNLIDNKKKLELIITESINNIINNRSDLYNYIIDKYNILKSFKY